MIEKQVKSQLAKNMNPRPLGGRMCQGIKGRTEGWLGVRLGYFIDAHSGEGERERAETSRTPLPLDFQILCIYGLVRFWFVIVMFKCLIKTATFLCFSFKSRTWLIAGTGLPERWRSKNWSSTAKSLFRWNSVDASYCNNYGSVRS